jgi:cellulose synthase/poly-beta-1,6-N-acetylglucosamine synthase-like glycosyltransferase
MNNSEYPKISIIVACLNEESYIEKCLISLINQNYKGEFDIIVADGGSIDNTIKIIKELQNLYPNIILINNPDKYQSSGRNLAINFSDAELIAYLDAHRYADKSWLSELWNCLDEYQKGDEKIAGVGSVHFDAAQNEFSYGQEIAFRSILSGATSANFLKIKKVQKVDHSCMMLYKKDILLNAGLYKPELKIGEDIELNHRLTYLYGYNLYLNPKSVNYYYPRETVGDLFKQQFNYGYWRQVVFRMLINSNLCKTHNFNLMRIKTIVPGIFILSLLILIILSLFSIKIFILASLLIFLYLFVISISSVFLGIINKVNPVILIACFMAIHFGYGTGVLSYFLRIKGNK